MWVGFNTNMKNTVFSKFINSSLIERGHYIWKQTAIPISTIKTNGKSVFGVWIGFVFVGHANILECWVSYHKGLCLDTELDENGSQASVQSSRIQ